MTNQHSFNFELFKIYQSRAGEPKKVARIRFTSRYNTVLIRIYDQSSPTSERTFDITDLDDFVTTDPEGFRAMACEPMGWDCDDGTGIQRHSVDGDHTVDFARCIWNALVQNGFSVNLDTSSLMGRVPPTITKVTTNYALEA